MLGGQFTGQAHGEGRHGASLHLPLAIRFRTMSTRMYVPVLPAPSLQNTDAWSRAAGSNGTGPGAAGPSLQSPSSPNAPPSPTVPAVHDNRAGATPVALVHLPARIRGNRSVPCCARVKAVLGAPCCAQWGRAAAHHDVTLGVPLMAPPASTMVLDMRWEPRVESGWGRERSSVPQPSLGRGAVAGPPGSSSGPVGCEAGGQAPVGLLACSMQQARLPTITFVTMQLEPDY